MAHNYVHVGLEIGTSKIAAIIAESGSDGLIRIIGVGEAPSQGVRRGEVIDISKVLLCLNDAISAAEERADCEIADVMLAITGSHVTSVNSRGGIVIPEEQGEIDENDVYAVEQSARDIINIPQGNSIVHIINRHYFVDEQKGVASPIGMFGNKLEAEYHIIHGSKNRIQNNIRCAKEANLSVQSVVVSSVASAYAIMSQTEKEQGGLVLDIGGGTTDYIMFRDGIIRESGVLAVGGEHVTNDISIGLRLPSKLAERIKVEYADVSSQGIVARGKVEIEDPTYSGDPIEKRHLNIVAESRMRELLNFVKRRINFDQHRAYLGAGVILTGGASEIAGLTALASDVFGLPAKVASPRPIPGPCAQFDSPRFSTAIGLVLYAQAVQADMESNSMIDRLFDRLKRIIPGL